MENKKQLGGKRRGAGRKPVLSKKKQISLYVEGSKILKFGSEEKMKDNLYAHIDNFGERDIVYSVPIPASFDGKKIDKITHDEPAMWAEPKVDQYTAYQKEISECNSIVEVEDLVKLIKLDTIPDWQKKKLEQLAVEKSKTFDF